MLLDGPMPEYEFDEVHSIHVLAPPERTLEAVKLATLGEMPLVRLLFGVRSLPAFLARKRGLPTARTEPLYEQMLAFGFVHLAEEPDREVVCGGIGQMSKLRGGATPTVRNARGFVAFEEPGYAKVAINLSLEPADGGTRLGTETRVLTTDPASRRRFARYWQVIRIGSVAIRRSWLGVARSRAEREA